MRYDISIIGSGPGGYVAALRAAQLNKRVALIEDKYLGGVCLNEGCIPTKSLVASSNFFYNLKNAEELGVNLGKSSFDYYKIKKRKDKIVNTLRNNLSSLLLANKIKIFKGRATFLDSNKLQINEEVIYSDKIIIATGARPKPFPNLLFDNNFILNSSSILDMEKLPKNIAIIGGGYIGLEFASILNNLEVEVTIIEREDSLLSFSEESISKKLREILEKRGVKIYTKTEIKDIKVVNNKVLIKLNDEEIIKDKIFIAIGRDSNIEGLNLEKVGIKADKHILISENMQTNIKNVYAVGDVTGKSFLAHVAYSQAEVAIDNAFGNKSIMSYDAIPSAIFTNPEVASVGLTSKEAYEKGLDIKKTTFPFKAVSKAYIDSDLEGFIVLISDKKRSKILGAHIIGKEASKIISEITVAIKNDLKIDDLIKTIHVHPTYSEIVKEVCLLAKDSPLHFFKKR